MVGRGPVIALLLLLVFIGSAPKHKAEQSSSSPAAANQAAPAKDRPPANPTSPIASASIENKDKTASADQLTRSEKYTLWINLALLVVIGLQVLIAFRQARIYDQQREIMNRQVEHLAVIDRAYIEIVEMRMGALKVDEMVIVKTVFLNVGRSPAWNFRFNSRLIFLEKPQVFNAEWLKDLAPRGKGKVLRVEKELVNESPSNFIFTREQVQAMAGATAKLYIAGQFEYIDITGRTTRTSFVRIYDPETGTFNEYERADDDKTNRASTNEVL